MHPIHVSVSGNTTAEVRANLATLLAEMGGSIGEGDAPTTTAGKKPRATKAEKEATAAVANGKDDSNIFADAPPASSGKQLTKDDVNAAVQSALQKIGGAETRALLGRYGAQSTGGVKVEDYAKLVAECEKLAAK
jgi:hypothetical protein